LNNKLPSGGAQCFIATVDAGTPLRSFNEGPKSLRKCVVVLRTVLGVRNGN
jgi:hypothetical protein